MVIDISTQQIIVTLLLGTIAYIGSKYGDSSTKYDYLFFVGGIAGILAVIAMLVKILIDVSALFNSLPK